MASTSPKWVPDTEDIVAFEQSIASVLSRVCTSRAIHQFADGDPETGLEVWRQAAELGWFGADVSEAFGGSEMGVRALDVLYRQLGRVTAPGDLLSSLVGMQVLSRGGDTETCRRVLPAALLGEERFAIPMTMGCSPLARDNGAVSGRSAGYLGDGAASLVIAPVDCGEVRLALIRIKPGRGGIIPRPTWDLTRTAGDLECEQAEVLCWLGSSGASAARDYNLALSLAVAADSIGGGAEILERTVEYMKGRKQFGQSIAQFQALKHRVANVKLAITAADGLLQHALQLAERDHADAEFWGRIARVEATRCYKLAAEESVLLHGGVGFTVEYDCHLYLKRARMNQRLGGEASETFSFAGAYLAAATRNGSSLAEIAW